MSEQAGGGEAPAVPVATGPGTPATSDGGPAAGAAAPSAPAADGPAFSVDAFPQEIRPLAEQQFRSYQEQIEREHKEQAERWGPYEQVEGLSDIEPDTLSELVKFDQMLSDQSPEGIAQTREWLSEMAELYGVGGGGDLDEDGWTKMGEEKGWFAPDDGDGDGEREQPGDPRYDQLVETVQQMQQKLERGERDANVAREQQAIKQELAQLHEEFSDFEFEDEDAQAIALRFMQNDQHQGDELRKGVEQLMKIAGRSKSELVDEARRHENVTAMPKGRPNTEAEKIPAFHEDPRALKSIALARAKQQNVV